MTKEQTKRTIQALAETDELIAKERGYLPQHQKTDYLTSLEQHAEKLASMIRMKGMKNGFAEGI